MPPTSPRGSGPEVVVVVVTPPAAGCGSDRRGEHRPPLPGVGRRRVAPDDGTGGSSRGCGAPRPWTRLSAPEPPHRMREVGCSRGGALSRVTVTAAHDGYRTSGSSRLSFWDTVSRTLSATLGHGQVPQLVGLDPDLFTVGVGSNDIPAYYRARFDDDPGRPARRSAAENRGRGRAGLYARPVPRQRRRSHCNRPPASSHATGPRRRVAVGPPGAQGAGRA